MRSPRPGPRLRMPALLACAALLAAAAAVAVPAQARGERARRAAPLRGAWVAYAVRPAIRLVRLDGTGDHLLVPKIAGDQEHPDWSPDGSKIVFQLDFKSLWVVGADGSDP